MPVEHGERPQGVGGWVGGEARGGCSAGAQAGLGGPPTSPPACPPARPPGPQDYGQWPSAPANVSAFDLLKQNFDAAYDGNRRWGASWGAGAGALRGGWATPGALASLG